MEYFERLIQFKYYIHSTQFMLRDRWRVKAIAEIALIAQLDDIIAQR